MTKKNKEFNIIIVGTGGQGLITLLKITAEAALAEGYNVKTSELHGLSQRGGSVGVHIRFGKKIHSPLVSKGKADLILGLEMQECLKATYFANRKTIFLINKYFIPILFQRPLPEKEIINILKKFSKNIFLVPATEICQKELKNKVIAGIYLLSLAVFKNLIPLSTRSILKAIKKTIPEKYFKLNKRAFKLAKQNYDKI